MNTRELQCFVPTTSERRGVGDGPLHKHTFVVKDLIALAGHVSSFGNARWRATHEPATKTANLVERLLAAGASMVGLTKMDQLAYSLIGNVGEGEPPVNPLTPDRFTGGSSSGSASAVAGLADMIIGIDTAGSIRVPAGACGLFGIRPTHDAIDAKGVITLAESFDAVGLLARTASMLSDAYDIVSLIPIDSERNGTIVEVLLPNDALEFVEPEVARDVLAALAVARAIGAASTSASHLSSSPMLATR